MAKVKSNIKNLGDDIIAFLNNFMLFDKTNISEEQQKKEAIKFLEIFTLCMGKADSITTCNAGAIIYFLTINGYPFPKMPEEDIKAIHALINATCAKDDKADPLAILFTKNNAISALQDIATNGKSDDLRIKAIEKLTVLNNWLDSSDAEEVIKSNNELIATLNKLLSTKEQMHFAFNFIEDTFEAETPVEHFSEEELSIVGDVEITQ